MIDWIDADKRKPEDEQRVLGYWPYDGGCAETVTFHASDSDVDGRDVWRNVWSEATDPPTHWATWEPPLAQGNGSAK